MFHRFHIHIASVLSRCCICFIHILQVFYLDVAYVSHICYNNMFHLCLMYVASKCFMLQVFHRSTLSDGRMARALGVEARTRGRIGDRRIGAQRARAGSRIPPTQKRGGGQGKERGAAGGKVHVRGWGMLRSRPTGREEWRA